MATKKIDLNNASAKEIASIPKVSIKLAEKIVAARPFAEIGGLYLIKGIGLATFNTILEYAEVGESSVPANGPSTDFLIKRPDVVLLRFRAEDDGSVTLVAPNHDIEFPFSEPYSANRRQILTNLEASVVPAQFNPSLQMEVGSALTEAIIKSNQPAAAKLLAIFQKAQGVASKYGAPMTLQLAFDEKALSSAQLPWELWHDGASHTLADERLRLNRYITYYGERVPYEPVDPLRVLYVLSRPPSSGKIKDLSGRFQKSVSRLGQRVQTDYIRQGTFEAFSNAIANGQYHIVHFDGHGDSDPASGTGGLLFESGSRHGEFVTSDRISAVLKGSDVRLVVLAACLGSAVSGPGMFNAVAPALIRAGLPAVIANQFSIWDDAMGDFSEEFYASLARGESISAAVADGRRTMAHHRGQFFLPTLYMRVADGEGFLFSGEPETHRQWRMEQMQMLALWWWGMTEVMRAHYLEGIIRGEGIDNKQPPPPKSKKPKSPELEPEKQAPDQGKDRARPHLKNVGGTYEYFGSWFSHREYSYPPKRLIVEDSGKSMSLSSVSEGKAIKFQGFGTIRDEFLLDTNNPYPVGTDDYERFQEPIDIDRSHKTFEGESQDDHHSHPINPSPASYSFQLTSYTDLSFAGIYPRMYEQEEVYKSGISWWDWHKKSQKENHQRILEEHEMRNNNAAQGGMRSPYLSIQFIIPNPSDDPPVIIHLGYELAYVRISKA